MSTSMLDIIRNIPNIHTYPLTYVFETLQLKHKPGTLWLEFGVATGRTINYISKFASNPDGSRPDVYGFDSFEGLPEKWRDGFEKGAFDMQGNLPVVNENVVLVKGWFNETLPKFIESSISKIPDLKGLESKIPDLKGLESKIPDLKGLESKIPDPSDPVGLKVSFLHLDADLYSSTKYILDTLKDYLDEDCIVVFDELVNYPGFDGETGELRAFYEFIQENEVDYEWIGMNGVPFGMTGYEHENVALIIHSIKKK